MSAEHNLVSSVRADRMHGTFEAHLTINATNRGECQRFQGWCASQQVKCVLIELPHGEVRSQPMSASFHRGRLSTITQDVAALARRVCADGFTLARVKLEAIANNTGVPTTDRAAQCNPERYFEFHAKVLLAPTTDLDVLRHFCAHRQARLSSNALKQQQDGQTVRFVTARAHAVARAQAFAQFDQLMHDLHQAGYPVVHQVREYALFDSAGSLDTGWLDQPGTDT